MAPPLFVALSDVRPAAVRAVLIWVSALWRSLPAVTEMLAVLPSCVTTNASSVAGDW